MLRRLHLSRQDFFGEHLKVKGVVELCNDAFGLAKRYKEVVIIARGTVPLQRIHRWDPVAIPPERGIPLSEDLHNWGIGVGWHRLC